MATINLKTIQEKMDQTYFSDGVWDLVIGLIFLSFGLGIWINQNFWAIFPIAVLTLPLAIKRWITYPRTGYLKFKQSRKLWLSAAFFIVLFGLEGFLLILGANNPSGNALVVWLTQNLFLISGVFIAAFFCISAKTLNFPRLYLYALLSLIGFALIFRVFPAGIMLTLIGVIIILISIFVMRNFVRNHPKQNFSE